MITVYKLSGSSKIDFKLYLLVLMAVTNEKPTEEMYNISRFDKAWTVKKMLFLNRKRVLKNG